MASNDLESVEELLEYRANPDIASEGEEPPLCSAVRQGRRALVLARCYSIVLTAIFVGNVRLLLPMGKVSRARHRWNWLRVMRAWWNCLQSSVARSMR